MASSTETRPGEALAETLVAEARALAPAISAASEQIEAAGALPDSILDALHTAGAFRMAIPAAYGGLDADPLTCARVVEEYAAADASVGWCVMIAAQITLLAGLLPADGARELFRDPRAVACGVARQTGKAIPVDGGYRVTGRWPFASGSLHATWFSAECMVMHGDEPERNEAGETIGRVLFLPREQVSIVNTWITGGLRGTGSNDFVVEDQFVPEHRSVRPFYDPPVLSTPRYDAMGLDMLGHGTHALGVARGALQAARELAPKKVAYGGKFLAESARFQEDFAEAQGLIESARAYLYSTGDDLWARLVAGEKSTAEDRARVRLAAGIAMKNSLRAMDLLYAGVGTPAFFSASPFERRFRDLHAAAAHVMIGRLVMEAAGRVGLGMEAQFPFF